MYSENCSTIRKLRRGLCMGLELWHSFKMATMLVYREFQNSVFAPMFHHLCPGFTFKGKQASKSMVKMHHMMTGLRIAFSDDTRRAKIKSILKEMRNKEASAGSRSILKNIVDLLDFYIPAVSSPVSNPQSLPAEFNN
jgi:hypothetical protein